MNVFSSTEWMSLAQTKEQRLFYTSGSQRMYLELSFEPRKIMDVLFLKIHKIYK
jgi:hypothetical protein